MENVLAYIQKAIEVGALLLQVGQSVAPIAKTIYDTLVNGHEPTAEDWALLRAQESALRAALQAPLE